MRWLIAFGLTLSTGLMIPACLSPLLAQEDACLTRTIPVTPIDAHADPLQDLKALSLLGKVHGRPVTFLSTTRNTQPRRIMVCVDMSRSMVAGPDIKWPVTRMMLEDIAQAGPTVGQIGMELFTEKVFDLVNISPNPSAMRMKVASLTGANVEEIVRKAERRTALLDALWQAADQFTPPRPGDVIYVLTDGGDNKSQHTGKQLEEKLLSRSIRVFAFLPTVATPMRKGPPEDIFGPDELVGIVRATGGDLIYLCPGPLCQGFALTFGNWKKGEQRALLLAAAHHLYQQTAVSYDTEIRLPLALKKVTNWVLMITDSQGHRRKDIGLLYPHRLAPCEKATVTAPSQSN